MSRVKGLSGLCLAGMACFSGFSQPFSGSYELVNANSGMVLDVRSQATTNGAPVIQWIGNGGSNIAVAIKAPIQRCGRASVHQARHASSSGAVKTTDHTADGITATSAA